MARNKGTNSFKIVVFKGLSFIKDGILHTVAKLMPGYSPIRWQVETFALRNGQCVKGDMIVMEHREIVKSCSAWEALRNRIAEALKGKPLSVDLFPEIHRREHFAQTRSIWQALLGLGVFA